MDIVVNLPSYAQSKMYIILHFMISGYVCSAKTIYSHGLLSTCLSSFVDVVTQKRSKIEVFHLQQQTPLFVHLGSVVFKVTSVIDCRSKHPRIQSLGFYGTKSL